MAENKGKTTDKGPKSSDQDASWLAQQERQGRDWLKLSYAERLQWLEQAKQFAALALKAAQARKQNL